MKKYHELIDDYIYRRLSTSLVTTESRDPVDLLTWNRLDLGFKLSYLDLIDKVPTLALSIYENDIRSQTFGKFKEVGAEDIKNSFEKYTKHFDETYTSIQENGFDSQKSLVPLSSTSTILNGAHRTACAIHQSVQVQCCATNLPAITCDYSYFYRRAVPLEQIEFAVRTFIHYSSNCHIAFLWPSGSSNLDEAEKLFDKVVYKKEIKLSETGTYNLLYELYKHMDWLGARKNAWSGLRKKVGECFPDDRAVQVIVFQANQLEDTHKIKSDVRKLNGIGFSSIHITDTKEEAVRISELLLSENGMHFINHAKPLYNLKLDNLNSLKKKCYDHGISLNDIVVDGGSVLNLYGLRRSNDIDFLSTNAGLNLGQEFDNHTSQLDYYSENVNELIYDYRNYFVYNGLKFCSFKVTRDMKKTRNEKKDKMDVELMSGAVENRSFMVYFAKAKQKAFYSRILLLRMVNEFAIKSLRFVGLFNFARQIYRRFVRR